MIETATMMPMIRDTTPAATKIQMRVLELIARLPSGMGVMAPPKTRRTADIIAGPPAVGQATSHRPSCSEKAP